MTTTEKLTRTHLKKFKIAELKKELAKFKKDIDVRNWNREKVELFMMKNKNSFKYLLKLKTNKILDKKVKPGPEDKKEKKKGQKLALKEITEKRKKDGLPKLTEKVIKVKGNVILSNEQYKSLTKEQRKLIKQKRPNTQYRTIDNKLKTI